MNVEIGLDVPGAIDSGIYDGLIDDVRLYDTYLTAAEVRKLYNSYYAEGMYGQTV